MKKNIILLSLLLLTTGCRQFQQDHAQGSVSSQNGQFTVNYQLNYSTGNGYGSDTQQRFEDEIRKVFQTYRWGYRNRTIRSATIEVRYTEALVRLIDFNLYVYGPTGKTYASITKQYGVFDFNEALQKAQEFFRDYGFLLTGGAHHELRGAQYVDFTITEDLIDKIYIDGRGRDGRNGICSCYYDRNGSRLCTGMPGEDGQDGADVIIYYPAQLRDRLQLLEVHNEGGTGGFGGICTNGPDGPNGFWGRAGQVYYREI